MTMHVDVIKKVIYYQFATMLNSCDSLIKNKSSIPVASSYVGVIKGLSMNSR